ncbi:MAG: ABC transporter ATP-binding protein [Deferribacteres bacterium]|nr:ABC transporter ATP-binding protein [candidate division KSB1 bacterium]MCB9501775.1 ABC transporter ATP-binding protein [Deferribacteres bacterium]
MKRLLLFAKPYFKQWTFAIFTLFIASLLELSLPKFTQVGIDEYISTGNLSGLSHLIGWFFLVLLGLFISQFWQTYTMDWLGQKIMFDLRRAVFGHIQHLPLKFFNKNPVGKLMTRVTSDIESLNELFTSGLVAIFGDILTLVGIVIIMLILNWKLALLTLVVLPLLFIVSILFKIKVRDAFRLVRQRIAAINTYLQENISGMVVSQLFNREEKNFIKFDSLNRDHLQAFLKTIFYFALFFPLTGFISAVTTAFILWYGGVQVIAGALTFGGIVAFLQYVFMFYRPIRDLSEKYNILQAAMAASERVFHLLDESIEEDYVPGAPNLHPASGKIEFRDVWFAYNDETWILKNVNFTINPGENIAIVGATGSGKTTLINLLGRFYDIQKGAIYLDGKNVRDYALDDLRGQMSLVLQDVFLFAGTIAENISLGNKKIDTEKIAEAARLVNAMDFIEEMPQNLDTELNERGSMLSVGQRQLLAFARALAHDPAILILDEATSNIDTETERLIQSALEELMANRTSIIIAHRLSTIQHVDKIIVLHHGEIREIGSHQELLKMEGLYYKLYQLQFANQDGVGNRA